MKVIFTRDLKKVAKKGEIKEVKDGYAENFLIKNGYAMQLTEKNMEKHKKAEEQHNQEVLKQTEEAKKLKQQLEKITLVFKVKTGEHDKVFGSISPKQIKDELAKNNIKIEKNMIRLDNSISTLGFHKVDIELYPKVIATVKVHLVK